MGKPLLHQQALDRLCDQLEEQSVIIDFCSGKGLYSDAFVDRGFKVIALVDPFHELEDIQLLGSPFMEQARRGITVISKPLPETIIQYHSVDAIWAHRSFQNLKPKIVTSLLGQLRDWLKPQGLLYFSLPEGEGVKIIKENHGHGEKPRLIVYYKPEALEELLQATGFRAVHAWYEGDQVQKSIHVIAARID